MPELALFSINETPERSLVALPTGISRGNAPQELGTGLGVRPHGSWPRGWIFDAWRVLFHSKVLQRDHPALSCLTLRSLENQFVHNNSNMVANTSAREDNAETEPLLIDNSDAKAAVKGSARLLILIICGIVILAADFGFFLSQAPQTAVFEQIICRKHGLQSREATNATLGEMDPCKSEAVQSEVALILGYKDTFDVLPGMSNGNRDRVSLAHH